MSAVDLVPAGGSMAELIRAAAACRACELWEDTNGTVFGEGDQTSPMVLVGEQPGDQEDRRHRPFVGPAGRLLDQALEGVGIPREKLWITNSVKHFRHREDPVTQRRLHVTPDLSHLVACKPWLSAELNLIRPLVVVVLGATAAKALLPLDYRVTKDRGKVLPGPEGSGAVIVGTIHPSALLRGAPEDREAGLAALVRDLQVAVDEVRRRRADSVSG